MVQEWEYNELCRQLLEVREQNARRSETIITLQRELDLLREAQRERVNDI
jgi:hypothetical protein